MVARVKGSAFFPPSRPGSFRVEHLQPADPYELSDGHAIVSEPSGRRHARRNLLGAAVIQADPAVSEAGVDAGFALDERTLRAPDVAVGNLADEAGFAAGAPALAVEYVEPGSDESDLERKIAQLLGAGTQVVWVVRLGGERRVEVHRGDQPMVVQCSGEELAAPGILQNPLPVDALYDRRVAHSVELRNLLQREGYGSLDEVRAEGSLAQARAGIRRVLGVRGIAISPHHEATIEACHDLATLEARHDRAVGAAAADAVFRTS